MIRTCRQELPRVGMISNVSFAIAAWLDHRASSAPNGAGNTDPVQPDHRLPGGRRRAMSASRDRRITGLATNRIAELGVARAFQIARPFRDLTVYENVRIGALFGKAGPRDVDATTWRRRSSWRVDAPTSPTARPARCLTVGPAQPYLEVARAIATRADLLLADEPCAGLNPTETAGDRSTVLRQIRATPASPSSWSSTTCRPSWKFRTACWCSTPAPDRRRPAARRSQARPTA